MSPLARIRQAAACSAFGFFAGLALGAMGLAVGGAGVALMVTSSAVAAAAPGAGANMSSPAGHAIAPALAAQALPQPTSAQAAAATSAAQPPPQPTSAPAAAATSAPQPSPQPTPAQAAAATSAPQPSPQPTPAQAAAATSAPQPSPQPTPAQAAATSPAAQASQPVQLAPNVARQIARSALLTVEGTATADALQLSIRRVGDKSLISGDDVTVSVDGKNQSVTHEKGGAYELPINDLRGDGARDVDVTVAHDGIREIVSGKVSVAEASSTSLWRDHKQVAWWILNIVIILIAATAVSRRKG
jgi:hypothetical protein